MSDAREVEPAVKVPGGAAVIVASQSPDGRRYLILHRTPDDPHHMGEGDWAWGPPSGCREPGEDIAACAARELHEESGISAEPAPVATHDIGWAVFCHEVPWGTDIRLRDDEHDRYAWVSLEEACTRCQPETVADGIRLAAEYRARTPPMESRQVSDPRSTVVAYDQAWPVRFERLRQRLEPALRGLDAEIEHVGSTSVPGLAAKPIIDLDVVVPSADRVAVATERLEDLGYRHEGDLGITGREAFAQPAGWDLHHLYVVVAGSAPYRDHLDLRDYLRANPAEVARYAAVKLRASGLLTVDREAYLTAKAPLIRELLQRARTDSDTASPDVATPPVTGDLAE